MHIFSFYSDFVIEMDFMTQCLAKAIKGQSLKPERERERVVSLWLTSSAVLGVDYLWVSL